MSPLEVLNIYGPLIHQSPSPFHACHSSTKILHQAGFIELKESETWKISPNQGYYVIREDTSLIAFKTPSSVGGGTPFKIVGSHTDSPCFKLKSNPTSMSQSYSRLNVEMYGSPLVNSWLDRDLKLSGMIYGQRSGTLTQELIQLPWTFRIPQLAIHLDRDIYSKGLVLNNQLHTFPIAGLEDMTDETFKLKLQELYNFDEILSWDLCFHDTAEPVLAGMNEEFFISPRLDNLAMLFCSLRGLIQSQDLHEIAVVASFNHEEVGSQSHEGAGGNFLENTLSRIGNALQWSHSQSLEVLPQSLFISADMAHAVHPNYPSKHDPDHKPYMNQGPVLKTNVNQRYATSGATHAKMKLIASHAGVNLQEFQSRNDMGCGSTIGPSSCARLGIPGVDLGNPMLSMHSIREISGVEDFEAMEKLFHKFFVF